MDADNIMEQAKAIDEKVENGTLGQTEIMNGTLNDPYDNSSDRIVKVGNIADGTVETYKDKNTGETKKKEGTNIIVVEKTGANGNKYHRMFVEVGFLTPAKAGKKYHMSGAMKVNYKYDHQVYATQKEGTSENTGKEYKFISLALMENNDIKKTEGNDIPF
jgi:hypothetical protein